jgi:hypothetical protein
VIANVRADDAERMRGYGAKETIDRRAVALPAAVRQAHPNGVDVLIDLVHADAAGFASLASLVRPGGTAMSTNYVADEAALRTAGVTGINFALPMSSELLERLAQAVVDGRIVTPPITRISLEAVPAALNPAQARPVGGKTVITLEPRPAVESPRVRRRTCSQRVARSLAEDRQDTAPFDCRDSVARTAELSRERQSRTRTEPDSPPGKNAICCPRIGRGRWVPC